MVSIATGILCVPRSRPPPLLGGYEFQQGYLPVNSGMGELQEFLAMAYTWNVSLEMLAFVSIHTLKSFQELVTN